MVDALANLSIRVVSRSALPPSLARVHPDAATAELAIDAAAVLDADAFAAAPRSGWSVALAAQRACAAGRPCDPANGTCVAFTSTGCGGEWPEALLLPGAWDATPYELRRLKWCRNARARGVAAGPMEIV